MSHDDKTEAKDDNDWFKTVTFVGMKNGQFLFTNGRDPALGIDPNAQTIEDYKADRVNLIELRRQSVDALKAKDENEKEIVRLKDLLEEKKIALQDAVAKSDNLDRAVKSTSEKACAALRLEMSAAHDKEIALLQKEIVRLQAEQKAIQMRFDAQTKQLLETEVHLVESRADIESRERQKLEDIRLHTTEEQRMQKHIEELDNTVAEEIRKREEAEADAKKAQRKAEIELDEKEQARAEAAKVTRELQQLKSDIAKIGGLGLNGTRLVQVLAWYRDAHGPVPADVEKMILAGLDVVKTDVPVAETPKEPEPQDDEPNTPPMSDDSFFQSLGDDDGNEDSLEVDGDDIESETAAEERNSNSVLALTDVDEPQFCDSPTKCQKIATWTSKKFACNDSDETITVNACNMHRKDCGVFLEALQEFVVSPPADAKELRDLMVPIYTPTPNQAKEVDHEHARD